MNKTLKLLSNLLLPAVLLAGLTAVAQTRRPGKAQAQDNVLCECNQVSQEKDGYFFAGYTNEQAVKVIKSFTGMFKRPVTVYARPYACRSFLLAMLCDTKHGPQKFIFYEPNAMDDFERQQKNSDNFLLAHEIAHHVLGHTTRAYYVDSRQSEVLDKVSKGKSYKGKYRNGAGKARRTEQHVIDLPIKHLHEFEADALALWMTMKKGMKESEVNEVLNVIPKILANYDKRYDEYTDEETHPSHHNRELFLKSMMPRFTQMLAEGKGYETITGDGSSPLLEDARSFFAFQLLTADDERAEDFNKVEQQLRDSLNRRAFFSLDMVLGGIYQIPRFSRAGNEIPASASPRFSAGLRLGFRPWYKKHRFETDLKISENTFTTTLTGANGPQLLERFKTTLLYVQPRYVFNIFSRNEKFYARTSSWMLGLGMSAQVPLSHRYVNYALESYQDASPRVTLAPTAGIGYGVSGWKRKKGQYRVWISYLPQSFALKDNAMLSGGKALLHTIQMDVSFRFW